MNPTLPIIGCLGKPSNEPKLLEEHFGPWRHKRSMADFIFDREMVRTAMKTQNRKREEFAEAVGLTHVSALDKILRGERQIKVEEAGRIYHELKLVPIEHSTTKSVPIIGLTAAGTWREAVSMPIGRMVIPSHVAGHRAFAVEVAGDSMDLLIEDGGWIVVDPDDQVLRPGKSYLLQNEEFGVTVKRYQKLPARFEPVSTNPEHKAFEVSALSFVIVGRVVWKGSPV
jgi:SOS-response transcriptional repressor LexA